MKYKKGTPPKKDFEEYLIKDINNKRVNVASWNSHDGQWVVAYLQACHGWEQ